MSSTVTSAASPTALLVPVPRVGPWIAPWAQRYDPSSARGVPPHVTVLFPFLPTNEITARDLERLRELFASHPATEVALTEVGLFEAGEVLHLRPEPDTTFRTMTQQLQQEWPDLQPYGGRHGDPTPHVTVGFHIPRPSARHAARSLLLALPIRVDIHAVQLWAEGADGWLHVATFPLAPTP